MAKTPKPAHDETKFLATYRPAAFPRPAVTVDIVILTLVDADVKVLLVRRNEHPFKGQWALPGGFVRVGDAQRDQGESLDEAAVRELAEETGLPPGAAYLEQLRAFGAPNRDPRMRVISIAYFALVRPTLVPFVRAGGDVSQVKWFSASELVPRRAEGSQGRRGQPAALATPLAFDHDAILACALARARETIDDSNIAFELVPETFTIPELRAVHEAVLGSALDPGNFRKRFHRMIEDGLIEEAPGKRVTVSKPAHVYRFVRGARKG